MKDLDFELPICWITQPNAMFNVYSAKPPLFINNQKGDVPLEVVLTPYAVNDLEHCGEILYKATSQHNLVPADQFEVFRDGNAQITGN